MVQVPSQYQSSVNWAAGVAGLPPAVVAAQINAESGFNPSVSSSAGAQGIAQFLPSTWQGLGCQGSPYDANASFKCYAAYMYQLLQQEHGNVRNALAAYNAGPGNLQAGYGYADSILSAAGASPGLQAGGGSGAAAASTASAVSGPDCAVSWPTFGGGKYLGVVPAPSFGGGCMVHKAFFRHVVGGVLMAVGGLVALPGVILLAAFTFRGSGAQAAATQTVGTLGPYGRTANRVISAPGQRRQRRAQAAAKEQQAAAKTQQAEVRRESAEARKAAGSPAQQSRARRGLPPRQPKPKPKPKPPPEMHHE